jgi:hypothetical protein
MKASQCVTVKLYTHSQPWVQLRAPAALFWENIPRYRLDRELGSRGGDKKKKRVPVWDWTPVVPHESQSAILFEIIIMKITTPAEIYKSSQSGNRTDLREDVEAELNLISFKMYCIFHEAFTWWASGTRLNLDSRARHSVKSRSVAVLN